MWLSPFDFHYMILDCALSEMRRHWYLLSKYPDSAELLYADTPFASMLEVSPIIVRTDMNDPFLDWLYARREQRPDNWGCLLHSTANAAAVAAHFRSWITAYDDIGQEVFFRFYDPDILPHFVAALQNEERQRFFGPVNAFMCRKRGQELLLASEAGRPKDYDPAKAPSPGPCPCFTFQERHLAAMRPVFWSLLVDEVLTSLLSKTYDYIRHLPPDALRAKVGECLQSLADIQKITLPEVDDGFAFCLLAITSCSHFFESEEFLACVKRQGAHETLKEWKHCAYGPIPGLELWHDPNWLPDALTYRDAEVNF